MKWKASSLVPVLICAGVTAAVCVIEWLADRESFTPVQRLEWMTYDWRVRMAAKYSSHTATNLGLVAIKDESIDALLSGGLPYQFGLHWPRQVYARLVSELAAQGAKAIAFDVLFLEPRPDHPPALIDGMALDSDTFFAREIRRASNVILAAERTLLPADQFRTNAWAVGDLSIKREVDGTLRRVPAFSDVLVWHPLVRNAKRVFGWKLGEALVTPVQVLFPRDDAGTNSLPLNAAGEFDAALLAAQFGETPDGKQPPPVWELPFTKERVWHLGILLAAYDLKLDLKKARVDLKQGRIEIPDAKGSLRIIPVDQHGRFYIDWSLRPADRRLTTEGIEDLLEQHEARRAGRTSELTNRWAGKLVVVGSTATGSDLTDLGATPLENETYLMSAYWNIANSVLMDRFIHPLSLPWKLLLVCLFSGIALLITVSMRSIPAVLTVVLLACGYVAFACFSFIQWRLWLPIVLPVVGSLLVTQVCLITYQVRLEQRERRRTKDIFSKMVSPDVVRELLGSQKLGLGDGSRRHVTVFFADVRDFTEMADSSQQRAEGLIARKQLNAAAAEEVFNVQAAEILQTINLYLGIAADCIKKHGGTLDKYIGDCVMAFWGAPMPNRQHAVCCVRAVIEMQRAVFTLNQQRQEENMRREEENLRRTSNGEPPLPQLDILTLGSGINSGMATVGLMGSEAHVVNYTVFGREVNLAARLEAASGRARILIGEHTLLELQRDDSKLAAICIEQPPLTLKGFRDSIRSYEVPWRRPEGAPVDAGQGNNHWDSQH